MRHQHGASGWPVECPQPHNESSIRTVDRAIAVCALRATGDRLSHSQKRQDQILDLVHLTLLQRTSATCFFALFGSLPRCSSEHPPPFFALFGSCSFSLKPSFCCGSRVTVTYASFDPCQFPHFSTPVALPRSRGWRAGGYQVLRNRVPKQACTFLRQGDWNRLVRYCTSAKVISIISRASLNAFFL